MRVCQLTLTVNSIDGNSNLGMKFEGDENLLLPLIGGLSYAERWCNNRLAERNGEGFWETDIPIKTAQHKDKVVKLSDESQREYSSEQRVPRDTAIEATEYAIVSLQQRVKQMKQCPETSTFAINPEILQKL